MARSTAATLEDANRTRGVIGRVTDTRQINEGTPALDPARIRQLGRLIAGRQSDPFALDIPHIRLV
ncbi:hypothetical protein ACPOLB_25560 [Rubrivivax sp. RP6-9]|uniref:hypothetical protein n=1 Tax=Rubrivivax sp. RP6-9 TaxID=3415750 RepID=UPI003CC6ABCF